MPTDFPVSLERNTLKGGDKSRTRWKTAAPTGESRTVAARISPADAMENLRQLEQTQRLLGGLNVQEALTLEVGLLKLKL